MIVFTVLCKYEGCEVCASGAHIVGVFESMKEALKIAELHKLEPERHPHYFYTYVQEFEVGKVFHSERWGL